MPDIQLELSNSIGILAFVILLFLSMGLFRLKSNQASLGFSASNSNQAQGIFIAVVIIHHISQQLSNHTIDNFKGYGYLAVGVFFLLSGYGLVKSLNKREGYLKGFVPKKIVGLVFPFIIVNALTSVSLHFSGDTGLTDFFLYFASAKLVDTTSWFIISIFVFYIAFYACFNRCSKGRAIAILFTFTLLYIIFCKKVGLGWWIYISAPCFPIGALLAANEPFFNFWLKKLKLFWVTMLGAFVTIIVILSYPEVLWRLHASVICAMFGVSVYLVLSVIELYSPLSKLMGRLSLDSYLIHMKLMLLFSYVSTFNSFLWLIFYFVALVFISHLFNILHRYIGASALMRITNASSRS